MQLAGADGNLIYGLHFAEAATTGIHALADGVDEPEENIFRANRFVGSETALRIEGGSGTEVLEEDGQDRLIEQNAVSGTGATGILLQSVVALRVRSNSVEQLATGIRVETGRDEQILNNLASASGQYALYLESAGTVNVRGNALEGANYGAFLAAGPDGNVDVTLRSNTITVKHLALEGGRRGLWAHDGSTDLVVEHLAASDHSQEGIRIDSGSAAIRLAHLTVSGNQGTGIRVGGHLGRLTDSLVHDNQATGVRLSNSGDTLVARSQIYGNRNHGLSIDSGAVVVEANEVYGNTGRGIDVSHSGSGTAVVGGRRPVGRAGQPRV